jgi:signal transduction histidine kinase
MNIADPSICLWEPAPFLIVSGNIWGNFIYYSHLFPSLTILLLAFFVFIHNPRGRAAQALLAMALAFTAWSFIDLVLWASERSDIIMFFWSILIHFELLVYITAFYFIHTLFTNRWPSWRSEAVILAMFVPLVLFGHTSLNLIGFDFTNCWREALEGPLWQSYVYYIELLVAAWILIFAYCEIRKPENQKRKTELILATIGVLAFLISFSLGNILGSLENNWELGQYGLFGMPVFAILLTVILVRYELFRAKVLATEALVVGLGVLITSLLFVQTIENARVIAGVTLVVVIVLGILLIQSVKREISQRERIEILAKKLEKANQRLQVIDKQKSEFVSIASHQLRSPLTSIRGYASLLLEGSFGTLPQKATEALQRIAESSKLMAYSIEDYLNVSRIESGNMKYSMSDFNLRDQVEHLCDDLRPEAIKNGLMLLFKTDLKSKGVVNADLGKTVQIVQNLLHNSIKYTKEGSITVLVRDDVAKTKKIYVEITDTGVGMDDDIQERIFKKFERAKNANEVNTSGTGLGLYVAFNMAKAMGGTITAHSDGPGKGSRFTLEMPLAL